MFFQIEAGAPLLEEQVRQAKEQLHDLTLSTAAYLEAKKQPPERRSLRDELAVVLYERLQKHEEEEVRLKKERDTSRYGFLKGHMYSFDGELCALVSGLRACVP